MDDITLAFTEAIINTANTSILRTSNSIRSKPQQNPEIKALQKRMSSLGRKLLKLPALELKQQYTTAKNTYFNIIKVAKTGYQNTFLEKEDLKSIFKAMAYIKYEAFRTTLFLDPPRAPDIDLLNYQQDKHQKQPKLSKTELENACTTKIKGKTPGPDLITQEIITYAYLAIPQTFYSIYSMLINTGYYLAYQKQVIGVILKKPKKPDYSAPKIYRVIFLLNYLGKVLERILAQRLSYLAETTYLLYPT